MKYTLSDVLEESNRETLLEVVADVSNRCALNEYYLLSRKIKELRNMVRIATNKKFKILWSYEVLVLEAVALRLGQLELATIKENLAHGE